MLMRVDECVDARAYRWTYVYVCMGARGRRLFFFFTRVNQQLREQGRVTHFAERDTHTGGELVPVECGVRDSLSRSEVREITAGHQQGSGQRARALRLVRSHPSLLIDRRSASVDHARAIRSWLLLFSCLPPARRSRRRKYLPFLLALGLRFLAAAAESQRLQSALHVVGRWLLQK